MALRGLFWLSKDLYEKEPGFREAIEPDAQELSEIRNHIEHKYFKLHSELMFGSDDLAPLGLADPLAYSMFYLDFEEKTLRLLKMVRASIIYLSTAIHLEEKRRENEGPKTKKWIMPALDIFEDDWKI